MSEITLDSFTILLNGFKETIKGNPPVEEIRNLLDDLKNAASLDNELTFWQKDAIIARCNNYINGTYGSSSTAPTGFYKGK